MGRPFVDIDRGAIEYELTRGDPRRPPIVFLHEGLGSIDLWRGVPAEIGGRCGDPTSLVYARHGHGHSGPPEMPRPVSYMHHEADVVLPALLDRLGLESPVLVGHSDGASIALLYAGAGGPASGLVCIAPHVFVEPESIAGIESARRTFDTSEMATRMALYHADPIEVFRGWNDVWLSDEFRDWSIGDRLAGIDAPMLLVQGADDQYGTLAQLDAIEVGVTGAVDRLVVEHAGHSPHLDQRASVVAAIASFVDRC